MTYRELLKRFQNGELDPEQENEIRVELEKHEALGDFLFHEEPWLEEAGYSDQKYEDEVESRFTAGIQKTIHHTFWKLGMMVGIAVMLLISFLVFGLPHIVDCFYYDPTAPSTLWMDENHKRSGMDLDLSVWTELFYPCGYRDETLAESLGYGKYLVTFRAENNIQDRPNAVSGLLTRDEMTFFDPNAFSRDRFLFFRPEDLGATPEEQETAKTASFRAAEKLWNETDDYTAYIVLNEPIDYKTFFHWCNDMGVFPSQKLWCDVYTDNLIRENIGFSMDTRSRWPNLWDNEQYPNLVMGPTGNMDEASMRQHFVSLLRYTQDHPAFVNMMGTWQSPLMEEKIECVISYVEENGLQIQGFAFCGKKADFMKLETQNLVKYLSPFVVY